MSARETTGVIRKPTAGAGARVLVIDDERLMLRALKRTLSNHDVTVVDSGREALALLESSEFDVILCDLNMPGFGGADVYEAVRARDVATAERIVFMTGGAVTARHRELMASVPNARVPKPFDSAEVRALVESMLQPSACAVG